MKLRTLLLGLILITGVSLCAQPGFHTMAADKTIDFMREQGFTPLVAYPIGGIIAHLSSDAMIGEAGLGEFQLDIAGVRLLIMYANSSDKIDFLCKAFWGLFPDIWDKGLNRNDFHKDIRLASGWTPDGTNLLEEVAVLSYTVKF